MTEEIKEILDTPIFMIDNDGFTVYINDKINNYITNLQKENEILQKDNESLKRFYNDLVNKCENLIEKYQDYKQRSEKAVEFIKNETEDLANKIDDYAISKYLKRDLLNILESGNEND